MTRTRPELLNTGYATIQNLNDSTRFPVTVMLYGIIQHCVTRYKLIICLN